LAADAAEQYNQLFFEVSGLIPGQHRIEVVHGGNNQTTPLSLDYVVIQNAPAPAGSNSSSAEHKGASTGAIAGGVVGGVVVLAAVILFLLLLRRRRKRNDMYHDFDQEMSLPLNIVPPSVPISLPASAMLSSPMPGGKSEHIRQYASQSTIPPGPCPPRSHNPEYSFSEASEPLALAT
jgi:hypothetical protein